MIDFFANPTLWVGVLAISLPLALHWFNRKPRRRTDFPALEFLLKSKAQTRCANSLMQWLILLLRIAGVVLLTIAFCRPVRTDIAERLKSATVLIWDDSVSMTAREIYDTQKKSLLAALDAVSPETPATLGLWRDNKVLWSGNFSGNRQELQTFFAQNARNASGGDFAGLFQQAELRFFENDAPTNRLCLFTDHQLLPWKRVPRRIQTTNIDRFEVYRPKPATTNNLVMETLETTLDSNSLTVRVSLRNHSPRIQEGTLILETGGGGRRTLAFKAPALRTTEYTLTQLGEPARPYGHVTARTDDDIAADNTRYFTLEPRGRRSSTGDSPLISYPGLALELLPAKFSFCSPAGRFHVETALEQRSDAELDQLELFVRQGGALALTPTATPRSANFLERFKIRLHPHRALEERPLHFGTFQLDHVVFARLFEQGGTGWHDVLFQKTIRFTPPPDAEVLATFENGAPAIVELRTGRGKLFIVATPPEPAAGNWVGHYSYLPFWRELEKYATAHIKRDFTVNSILHPEIQTLEIEIDGNFVPFHGVRPDRPGIYRSGEEYFAVNLAAAESDPTADTMPDRQTLLQPAAPRLSPTTASHDAPLKERFHPWLLAAALCWLTATFLANRTAL